MCAEMDEIASFRLELTPVQQPFWPEWHIQDRRHCCCQRMCNFGLSLPIYLKPVGGMPSHLGHKTSGERSVTVLLGAIAIVFIDECNPSKTFKIASNSFEVTDLPF